MKKMVRSVADAIGVIAPSWSALLCFEMAYRGIGFLLLFPLLCRLLSLLPGLVGQAYLGQENLALIARHPAAWLLLLAVVLLAGLYLYFEITALFLYAEKGWRRERVSVWALWRETARQTASLLRPSRLPVFLLLPAMALSVFSVLSGYLPNVKVPEFVMEVILAHRTLLALFAAAVVLCHLVLFLYLFGFPSLLLSGRSFTASCRESWALLRGNMVRTAGALCGAVFLFWIALQALAGAGVLLLGLGMRLRYPDQIQARMQFQGYFLTLQGVWGVTAGAVTAAFLCAVIVARYHAHRKDPRPARRPLPWTAGRAALRAGAVLATLALLLVFSESELGGRDFFPADPATRIVAHRAGAAFGPENTVAALYRAAQDGADLAEIDVQQLGDGTLVVMHDTNFLRTTGVDLDVWDADYEMVRTLDAGSHLADRFAGEPVPTLDDMLTAAKGRIGLMIELKSTGREQDLVRQTLALIQAHGMTEDCMIASMDMELLKQTKALNPKMKTVFISVLVLTQRYDRKELDAYSVETTSLTLGMVIQAHLQGKQVYAWTANSEANMDKVLRCQADGLITDNPLLAEYQIEAAGENILMEELTDLFFPIPR